MCSKYLVEQPIHAAVPVHCSNVVSCKTRKQGQPLHVPILVVLHPAPNPVDKWEGRKQKGEVQVRSM